MNDYIYFDSLAEFHLHHSDEKICFLIQDLISVLQQQDHANFDSTFRQISNLLGDGESISILKLICRKNNVDYVQFMQDCQKAISHIVSPKLLLHVAILPKSYIVEKLQIDEYWVTLLIDELHKSFTIDNPVEWLKRLLTQTQKERLHYEHAKEDLLHGLDVVNQPVDTAEERKKKERKSTVMRFRPRQET